MTHVSRHGVWILVDARELFMPYVHFPWFEEATLKNIMDVVEPSPGHLYWPGLDVDLAVDIIEHPERFPMTSRAVPRRVNRSKGRVRHPRASVSRASRGSSARG